MWYWQLQGIKSTISCAFCPYSPKLVNKAFLRECEFLSQKLWITDVLYMRWGHDCSWKWGRNQHIQSKKTLTFSFYLTLIIYPLHWRDIFEGYCFCNFEEPPVYCIYSPCVYLVLCKLLNVMVVCLPIIQFLIPFGFWFIVCSSFSMKCLHIDPCLCLFSQLLHNFTVFDWHVFLSLRLYLVYVKYLSTVKIRYYNTFTQVALKLVTGSRSGYIFTVRYQYSYSSIVFRYSLHLWCFIWN